ncbi:cupin domain-containing protein [Mycobacterium antarcticum]|uniref:hypothetical protein n=1 Tax=Mycolicibacterium sp. TUM20985 TaxID=3023370 RepID=UPI002572A856|nr:hypothetical protein [Mycolicibacterium sp. TUM20985]
MAQEIGEWDERPVSPPFADPQVHLSRSVERQPFFLICEKDTVLMQTTGSGKAELRYSGVRETKLTVGDLLYVPGGTASRIEPHEESIYIRFKPVVPGLEAVAWFCPSCDAELWRYEFDASQEPAQLGYDNGCKAFNADAAARTCGSCQTVHDPVDSMHYRWSEVADLVGAETDGQPT